MYSVAFDIGTNYISGMMMRKIQYRLYPNSTQTAALEEACELHRQLYNAALEERIAAYRMCGVSVTFVQQDASLTVIRNEHPAYAALPRKALVETLRRLDLAFAAFFRRCKAGETPGFPRFKARDRFKGFGFRTHGDGAAFRPGSESVMGGYASRASQEASLHAANRETWVRSRR